MSNFLSKKQREELLEELSLERQRRYAERIKTILLCDEGKKQKDIAEYLFLDEATVANYKNRYKKGGIEGLLVDNYSPKMSFLTKNQENRLKKELRRKIYHSSKEVLFYIEKEFKIEYSVAGVTALLHRLGFSYKKATAVPGKADRKRQEKFIRRYKRLKKKDEPIYFSDGTHPECQPHMTSGWIEKGKTFEVKTNSGWRKRVNIFGAINIDTLESVVRTYKTIDALSVCDVLKKIRAKHSKDVRIHFILDGAGYNRSEDVTDLALELNINLVYLPSYSPNLNPIERLWKLMKKNVMANRYYDDYDDFKNNLSQFFRNLRHSRDELETLITDNFSVLGT